MYVIVVYLYLKSFYYTDFFYYEKVHRRYLKSLSYRYTCTSLEHLLLLLLLSL